MSVEIVFGVNLSSSEQTTVTDDDISRFNPVLTHTGKADLSATLKGNRNLEQYAQRQDRINVIINGTTKWTGYLTDVSHDKGAGSTRIRADGIGKRLEETRPDYDSIGGPVTYTNTPLHDAIRDYWGRTEFSNVTVTDQTPETVATDETVQNPDTTSEWQNYFGPFADDVPIKIENGALQQTQVNWLTETNDAGGTWDSDGEGSATVTDPDYSDGDAILLYSSVYDLEFTFTTEHKIPSGEVNVAFRHDTRHDTDRNHQPFDIEVDGTVHTSLSAGALIDELDWQIFDDRNENIGTLEPGAHTLRFVPTGSANDYVEIYFDLVGLYDRRYDAELTFDNTVHADGGYLDGPELYPTSNTTKSDITTTSFNVTEAHYTGTWNDTSNNQQIGVSNDGGSSFERVSNTDSFDVPFSSHGREVVVEYTLSRYGSRDTATPRTGFSGQSVDLYDLSVDGNDLVVISELELSRNHFDNLKTLHGFGGFLWTIEHGSGAIGDLPVSSYRRGDETRPAPDGFDNQKNQQPEIQSGTYYNSIYLEGALRDDGTRPSAEVKDEDAIAADGREISPGVLRDLNVSTGAGASYRARALLETAQQNNNLVGSVTVPPTMVAPGYSRPIDFGNGEQYKTVEEVRLNLGTNSAEATFDFSVRSGFSEEITDLKRNGKEVGNQV